MRNKFALLTIIMCFITMVNGAFAMTPRVKFPEWNKTSIILSDWDAIKGILTITVQVEANRINLGKTYSQPYLQSSFNTLLTRQEKDEIKQGDKAEFVHRLNIKSNTENWLEMDIRCMPDVAAMKYLIRKEYSGNPAMLEILEAEANEIKAPIFIGTSMPILVRDDIAISATPEIAFIPSFNYNGNNYYIWLPLDTAESQTTCSAIKLFKAAIESKDAQKIEKTGIALLNRFDTDQKSIVFKKANGDNFMIPTKVALEMLKADIICLKAVLTNKTDELESELEKMSPSYTKAFMAYNLSALFKSLGDKEKLLKYKRMALSEQPAWPLAESL